VRKVTALKEKEKKALKEKEKKSAKFSLNTPVGFLNLGYT